jgi:hypothetical protein
MIFRHAVPQARRYSSPAPLPSLRSAEASTAHNDRPKRGTLNGGLCPAVLRRGNHGQPHDAAKMTPAAAVNNIGMGRFRIAGNVECVTAFSIEDATTHSD